MPRQPRQFEIGGIYHIVNRGVEKRKIFLSDQDYNRFILGLEFFNDKDSTNLWPLLVNLDSNIINAIVGSDPTIALRQSLRLTFLDFCYS